MKHYLNVCDVSGFNVEPVDIITFGSPCQDLSVAGKRAGLKHEDKGDNETTRSGLFMEAVRIIKEMREATNGEQPKFALWENVPGAFSSNKGKDFRIVLEELAKIVDKTVSVPEPPKGKWTTSGFMALDGGSIAWRVVDAQYHGVAQRRRRVLAVLDLTGQRAGEISFKCEGLPGYPEEEREQEESSSGSSVYCLDGKGIVGVIGPEHQYSLDDYLVAEDSAVKQIEADSLCNQWGTEIAQPIILENHPADSRVKIDDSGTVQTLTSRMGTGGGNVPMVMEPFGVDMYNQAVTGDKTKPLTASATDSDHVPVVVAPMNWDGSQTAPTLTANNANGAQRMPDKENFNCVLEPVSLETFHLYVDDKATRPLKERDYKDPTVVAYGIDRSAFNQGENAKYDFSILPEQITTMVARGPSAVCVHYIVRRLTPIECARLQGFPDNWGCISPKSDMTDEEAEFWRNVYITHQVIVNEKKREEVQHRVDTKKKLLAWYNKLWNDGAEYKMWGNGVALPCVRVPIHNMAKFGAKTMASLFDGSGGFPLAATLEGIKPIWCSEIEPYPIAVTMERFPEVI